MKNVPVSIKQILQVFFLIALSIYARAANYTDIGTTTTYNLNSGDTLFVKSGTYAGYITSFPVGAVVMVDPAAVFQPGNIYLPAGKITNYGTTLLSNYGSYPGAAFDNYGILSIAGDIILYDGAVQNLNNHLGANMFVSGDLRINSTNLINEGNISIGKVFHVNSTNAYVKNTGFIAVNETTMLSYGRFENLNSLTTGELDIFGDIMINSGIILPAGKMYVGSNASYTNNCKVNTGTSFENHGITFNNGLILTGKTGTSTDEFINSGTFIISAGASEASVNFTNYGTITGSGFYSILGESSNVGNIGTFRPTSDSIIFYDDTRSGSAIIDNQWGTLFPNAIFRPFTAPDMSITYSGCSSFAGGKVLPVVWKYFYLKSVQNKPELQWSAEYEPNMKFTVQRSYDQTHFEQITSFLSNRSAVYNFTDTTADYSHSNIYYRILAMSTDGSKKYSVIKVFKPSTQTTAIALFPNPATNTIKLSFTSNQKEQVNMIIVNASGQQLVSKTFSAEKGANQFDIDIQDFKPGVYALTLLKSNGAHSFLQFIKQ